jgi:hypothetical protein
MPGYSPLPACSVSGEGASALGKFSRNDQAKERARRSGALLRACGLAALTTGSAIGVSSSAAAAAFAAPGAGEAISSRASYATDSARATSTRDQIGNDRVGARYGAAFSSDYRMVVSQGAFDIAVEQNVGASAAAAQFRGPAAAGGLGKVEQQLLQPTGAPSMPVAAFKGGVIVFGSIAADTVVDHPPIPDPHHDPVPLPPPPDVHHDPVPPPPAPDPHHDPLPPPPDVHHDPVPPPAPDPHHDPVPPPPPPDHHHDPVPPPPDHHPPPPPPPDHHPPAPPPPPPPPAAKLIVPWLNGLAKTTDNGDEGEDVDVVLDISALSDGTGDDFVDAGVTSGSDASSWDPIDVSPNP